MSFPIFQSHGYNDCMACHVSPTGGGALNIYGKMVRPEILSVKDNKVSTWDLSFQNQQVDLNTGLQVKLLQFQKDLEMVRIRKFLLMQSDATLTLKKKILTAHSSLSHHGSREHYVMLDPKPNLTVRAGKFLPRLGAGFSDHTIDVKRQFGFTPNNERYSFDFTLRAEPMWFNLALDELGNKILNSELNLGKQTQGIGLLLTKELNTYPILFGVYSAFDFIALYQINFSEDIQWNAKILHKISKGVYLYLVNTGLGVELYPYAGINISAEWQNNTAWLLLSILL